MNRLGHCVLGGAAVAAFAFLFSASTVAAGGGSISGTVKLNGPKPAPAPHEVTADKEHCGGKIENESCVVADGGLLKNAVVTLEGVADMPPAPKTVKVRLSNKGCRFDPHVLAVQQGTTLEMSNEDPVFHNVHITKNGETVANNGLPPGGGQVVKKQLKDAGLLDVRCDAGHTWMKAYIVVVPHTYFAVTGADGKFSLAGVPAGKYKLKVWHETLGTLEQDVEVKDGADAAAAFEFTAKT